MEASFKIKPLALSLILGLVFSFAFLYAHQIKAKELPYLKEGDFILRMGLDADSKIIALYSKSKFSLNPLTVIHANTSDSNNKDKLYCTTFLEESIKAHFNLNLKYEEVNFGIFKGLYLFPQAFLDDTNFINIFKQEK